MTQNIDINNVINLDDLQAAKTVLKSRFGEMIDNYTEDMELYLKSINEGLDNGDLKMVYTSAHPMNSASASLGVIGVSELAAEIEAMARDSQDIEAIQTSVKSLTELLECVIQYMHKMNES
ncbi:MAG: Hpt domain-containing protein [Rickettsiales bacterium]|nr:Hpt domain-containing protein [Rickettsiales bacterium]